MRVAALYTGFLRKFEHNFESHLNLFLRKYNVDIFVSTWNRQEDHSEYNQSQLNFLGDKLVNVSLSNQDDYTTKYSKRFTLNERVDDIFKIDSRAVESNKPYGGPEYWVNRLLCQWYLVKEGFESIGNPENYDLIVRLRTDLYFTSFELENNHNLVVPYSPAELQGLQPFNDHIAYGDPKSLREYSKLFNNMVNLYNEHNFDISYAEKVLKFHLDTSKVEYSRTNKINYFINK